MRALAPPPFLGWALSWSLVSCGGEQTARDGAPRAADHDRALATVAGQPITRSEFEQHVRASAGRETTALETRVLQALLEQLIEERLVVALAVERGVSSAGAGVQQALAGLIASLPEEAIDEAAARRYYKDHAPDYDLPERVELHQVLVEERAHAELAIAALAGGEEFTAVARRLSIDPSAGSGGLQGEFARDELPVKFAAAVFALEAGQWSEPIEAEYGYHVFYVARRFVARLVPFDEARPAIEREIARRRRDDALDRLLAAARASYNVRIHEQNVPWRVEPNVETSS